MTAFFQGSVAHKPGYSSEKLDFGDFLSLGMTPLFTVLHEQQSVMCAVAPLSHVESSTHHATTVDHAENIRC